MPDLAKLSLTCKIIILKKFGKILIRINMFESMVKKGM